MNPLKDNVEKAQIGHMERDGGVDIKKPWANTLARLRRQLRGILRQQKEAHDIRQKLKDALAIETKKTFKNQYRIAELQKGISDLDIVCSDIESKLYVIGGFLFKALPMYEEVGATDHDFAQLINCNAKRMEQIRADFNERDTQGHSFFADAVFIWHAEQPIEREKESFVIFSDLPFFDAMTVHFMKTLKANPQMRQAVHDKIDELFPELRAHQCIIREGTNGEVTLEKYYPPLKVMKSS